MSDDRTIEEETVSNMWETVTLMEVFERRGQ